MCVCVYIYIYIYIYITYSAIAKIADSAVQVSRLADCRRGFPFRRVVEVRLAEGLLPVRRLMMFHNRSAASALGRALCPNRYKQTSCFKVSWRKKPKRHSILYLDRDGFTSTTYTGHETTLLAFIPHCFSSMLHFLFHSNPIHAHNIFHNLTQLWKKTIVGWALSCTFLQRPQVDISLW